MVFAQDTIKGPYIDWAAISPLVALAGGAVVVLMLGLARSRAIRTGLVPLLTVAAFGARRSASPSGSGTPTTAWSPTRCASTR